MARIAMISEHASPLATLGSVDSGGQNVYVAQLTSWLARNGHEVDVFTRRDDRNLPEVVRWRAGARIIHVPAGPAKSIPKEDLLPHMGTFAAHVERHCIRRGYDLTHAHFWMSGMVAAHVKKALGIPFVVTFHALGRIRRLHQGSADGFPDCRFEIEERIARQADRIIAECPQDRADLVDHYAADPQRISIVPCGFDPEELRPVPKDCARACLGLPRDAFVVLQLGRIVPRKGIATVIEGFAEFCNESPKAQLLIVGGESREPDPILTPEIARLMTLARAQGVSSRVRFAGRRDRPELRCYYSAADVFVTLPWYEPFGITPLEAMACAVPVIGSRVGGVKYTVQNGVTGWLIPASDPHALAERLHALHGNRRMVQELGRRGQARALSRFTWSRVAREIEAVYEKVLVRGSRAGRRPAARVACSRATSRSIGSRESAAAEALVPRGYERRS